MIFLFFLIFNGIPVFPQMGATFVLLPLLIIEEYGDKCGEMEAEAGIDVDMDIAIDMEG